jgi:hypothetical protein
LGGELDGVPGAAKGWGVAEVQVTQPVHGHVVEQGTGGDVDTLGHLGAVVADQLGPQQLPAGPVAGDPQVEVVGARVVGLVVELDRADRDGVEAGRSGVGVAKAGAGHGQLEHLDHLGPEGAGEAPVPAHGGLAGDPTLLVGSGAQRQVGGRLEQPMPGLHTVPGGQHIRQVGPHVPVDPQRPPHPGLHPSGDSQLGVGPDPDHDQDQLRGDGEVGLAGHGQAGGVVVDGLAGDVVDHLDVVAAQLLAQQPAQVNIDGGHDRRGLLDHGDRKAAGTEGLGHLQADVATPNDDRRLGAGGQGLVKGEGVAHGVQHMDPGQVQSVDRGADRDRARPDHQPVIAQLPLAVLAGDGDLLAGWVDGLGGVVE